MKADIMVAHGTIMYYPPVLEGITVDWERKGSPGKLSFEIARDEQMKIREGDGVRLQIDGKDFFFGFVFTKKYNKGDKVAVTVYDQLRYFKNKDTYVYTNKTASDVIRMVATDFQLRTGLITETGYIIKSRVEQDTTLFDIAQNALDETLRNNKKLYVLYDDCGALTLQDIEAMRLPLLLDGDTVGDFDYQSTIDNETYNQIKVVYEDSDNGARKVYVAKDSANINKWGVLQLTDKVETAATGAQKANALLGLYDMERRTLSVKDVLGDTRVRAGFSIVVKLDLGDVSVQNYMMVENAKHTFTNNQHLMDLKLRGGIITG